MRVVVLGLDGATWDLLDPLIDRGVMPNLDRIRRASTSGRLRSVWPPLSPVAWPSAMTGKQPGRHGVFEFLGHGHDPIGGAVNTSKAIEADLLWEIAGRAGLRSLVGGVPLSYPLRKAPGFQLGDFLSPPEAPDFASEPALFERLQDHLGEPYRPWCTAVHDGGREVEAARALTDYLDHHLRAVEFLVDQPAWDLLVYDLMAVDRAQHELWHVWDENHPKHADIPDLEAARTQALAFWKRLDDGIGRIQERLDDDTALLLISDHGFGPITHYVNFNVWLLDNELLQLRDTWYVKQKHWFYRRGVTPEWIYGIMSRLGLAGHRVSRFQGKQSGPLEALADAAFLSRRHIDWSQTRAYSRGNFGQIYVNLKGRQPHGCVAPADYRATLDEIKDRLMKLEHPEDGGPLIDQVFEREDLFDGPHLDQAPDLIAVPRDWRYRTIGLHDFTTRSAIGPAFGPTGDHRLDGIVIAHGPPFLKDHHLSDSRLIDIAPTVLHLLGLGVPDDMDGRVLEDLFDPSTATAQPVVTVSTRADAAHHPEDRNGSSTPHHATDDDEAIRKRLADLGYL